MIKINLSTNQVNEIEKLWFKWFVWGDRIQKFIVVLDNDIAYREMIFSSNREFVDWKNDFSKDKNVKNSMTWRTPIRNYIFDDLSDEDYVIKKYKKDLLPETIKFLKEAYENYRNTSSIVKIINIMKIEVCPYCNRNFLENYSVKEVNGKRKHYYKGDLDHHYSKDEIPALALSFYNLVPSCKVCNHEKQDSTIRTFYPFYDDEDIEYHFSIELYDDEDDSDIIYDMPIDNIEKKRFDARVWQGISDNFKIKLRGIDKKELNICMKNSNDVFRLEKKYNHSKEYVKEIIRKKYMYPDVYKEVLLTKFSSIFRDESELLETFYSYSNSGEYLYNRPLSKLTKDVLRQMGILSDEN